MAKVNFFWFRRDLRLQDNAGLYRILKMEKEVIPVFIFDKEILDKLEDKRDARVEFIYNTISQIKAELRELNSDIIVKYGYPLEIWKDLLEEFDVHSIYTNRDYETYAKDRDKQVKELIESKGGIFNDYKDHVLFESTEVRKDDGDPYIVFSPYKKTWLSKIDNGKDDFFLKSYPCEKYYDGFKKNIDFKMITLEEMGFQKSNIDIPPKTVNQSTIKEYDKKRNFPAIDGTSRLGIHYRFGTISIRDKARKAWDLNEVYLSELIWRDFYSQILNEFPHVEEEAFRKKYDRIEWRNNEEEFAAWCEGRTGYKIVDAGMRELNETGYMHNRVRMITASFLTKHLLIDWRWGEAYFAKKLLDYDLASNNGGWQWAAGSGTDAAPYFRIFNPYTQIKKFDKNLEYVNQWVPEHDTDDYPKEIVEHKAARERCLKVYKEALNQS
ncbi:cryptochrome/photolyase family protein [Portibacter marinus]|uniref:cryptochrome/photolyase family protein n=1 Tax=Portibacter marinus TaxID=2898660 RepID=UPI001F33FE62|nr:deoxyribodipyrimidine photo-lyase [Portibacter marinus]